MKLSSFDDNFSLDPAEIYYVVARMAWAQAGEHEQGHDISLVANAMVADHNDSFVVRDAILDALYNLSTETYTRGGWKGYVPPGELGEEEIWWIDTNAYSEWTSDMPDWWETEE